MKIRTKRVYDSPSESDGQRILIDRLWPRGLTKEKAQIDYWAKSIAPSTELRKWYQHDPDKWPEFQTRYFTELDANPAGITELLTHLGPTTTIVFSSKEQRLNNATALQTYLKAR